MDKRNPASVMEDLTRRGFTEQFKLMTDGLHGLQSGQTFGPSQIRIVEQYRFEGVSDPDDMSIVYAIETSDGARGTLVDAYGTYADPAVTAFLAVVPVVNEGPPET